MNATHSFSRTNQVARVVSIRKNQSKRGQIFTVRFSGEQSENTQARTIDRAKRAEIAAFGPDLFFAEWDLVD